MSENNSFVKWNPGGDNSSTTPVVKDAFYIAFMQDIELLPMNLIKVLSMSFYVFGTICNILLLVYIVKRKRYKAPTFTVIFSLCIGDTGTCIASFILTALVMPTLTGPEWLCSFCIWLATTFYFSSVHHVIMFSILRFYQLVFPLKARSRITLGFITKICSCLWLVAPLSAAVIPAIYKSHSFLYKGHVVVICECDQDSQYIQLLMDTVYLFMPNIIITMFHLSKHMIVKRHTRNLMLTGETQTQSRKIPDARAITVVIVVFCVTSLPHSLHSYAHFIFRVPIPWFHPAVTQLCINLLSGNSCLNPILYVLCSSAIRNDIVSMLKCTTYV